MSVETPLYTPGRRFHKYDPTVSTTVFHWFTPTTGNLSGAWAPIEGRENWTGEKDWWIGQIKQIMSANIDIIYLHLIARFEEQRINFFAAFHELRALGYDVPKLVPFLDPFGIWPPAKLDVASNKGKDEFVEHYIRFFEQYFSANNDSHADSYLGQIDGRIMLCSWWVFGILDNLDKFERRDVETRLARRLGRRSPIFENGIYMISTALIDPDLEFSDERTVFFSGYVYCVHSTHGSVALLRIAGILGPEHSPAGILSSARRGSFLQGGMAICFGNACPCIEFMWRAGMSTTRAREFTPPSPLLPSCRTR